MLLMGTPLRSSALIRTAGLADADVAVLIEQMRGLKQMPGAPAEAPECAQRLGYLERSISEGRLALGDLLPRLAREGSRVIYFGEDHHSWTTRTIASLVEQLRGEDDSFECLALEEDRRCQDDIDDVISGRRSFEQVARTAKKYCYYAIESAKNDLLEVARRNSIKVFAVDDLSVGFSQETGSPTQSVAATMPRRNEAMAQGTATLIRGGSCRKVVAVAGGAHLVRAFLDESDPVLWESIPDRLKRLGIKTSVVGIISRASYDPAYGDKFAPKECSWSLWNEIEIGSPVFGFQPRSPAPACFYPLYPIGDAQTLPFDYAHPISWSDYQGIVVVP